MKQVTKRQIKQITLKIQPDTTLEQMKDFSRKVPDRGLMILNGALYCEQSDESRDERDTWEESSWGVQVLEGSRFIWSPVRFKRTTSS